MVSKTEKYLLILCGPIKHYILSIYVLNMAKFTIISLILVDLVSIFLIFNSFCRFIRGSICFQVQKSPMFSLTEGSQPFLIYTSP